MNIYNIALKSFMNCELLNEREKQNKEREKKRES